VPFINQPLVPDAVAPGGPDFTLTVNGTGFVSTSTVNWNGSALATTFVSGSQLTAVVSAADIATASTASVTVVNPPPGGGTSNVVFFTATANVGDAVAFMLTSSAGVGFNPEGVAAGDFNGDGILDLAVANGCGNTPPPYCYSPGTVSILLGDGRGNFTLASSTGVGMYPSSVVVGDFNGDGKLDLAVVNSGISSPNVSILLGDGTGNFTLASSAPVGGDPFAVAVGDFNGDGKLDLAAGVYNEPFCLVTILLGDGTGNFSLASSVALNWIAYAVAVGDFNGDGKLDVAAALDIGTVSILLGDGTGNFSLVSSPVVGAGVTQVVVGDLNGDGKPDLAVANGQPGVVSILLGDGTGNFQPASSPAAGQLPQYLTVGDFNGDGKLDLAVTNYLVNTASVLLQVPPYPIATLSPTSLTFGTQLAGTPSSPQTVTLSNTGSATLDISSITASANFAETNTCGASVAAGASCAITVIFMPRSSGVLTGTITITDNASNSPQTIALTGTGTLVMVSPTSLSFNAQTVGTTSTPQTITVTNNRYRALTIASVRIGGADSGDFTQTNTCGTGVPAGGTCTISVTFTPQATGSRRATLVLSDSGGSQAVGLKGYGT
jgi:uncharacterized protein (DUF2141 family)